MPHFPDKVCSKLPRTGTTIFALMTQMAKEHGAINLSQGFPDFEVSPVLIELVARYMREGKNQYAPMPGLLKLREAIAEKTFRLYGAQYDPITEITVTAGATQGLFTGISTFVHCGDEVIVFEPAYDSYVPAIELNGGIVRVSKLKAPEFRIDWDEVRTLVNDRTRMIIINSTHNPTGSVLARKDLVQLERLVSDTGIMILSDEVYEHIIFDGRRHESVCLHPGLAQRSMITFSFGKTFHATGWKSGYCLAPENLMSEFRKTHQFIVYCVNGPVQYALADFLLEPQNYEGLNLLFERKRDFFIQALQGSRFKAKASHGTYFQLLDYEEISRKEEFLFAERLTKDHKIASVPMSAFYTQPHNDGLLRFCFAKSEETLKRAAEILRKI